jgi:hypothetical protein
MTLLAGASLRTPLAGTRSASSGSDHMRIDNWVPVAGHDQVGQNGVRSSKKTKTGICAQPTMS